MQHAALATLALALGLQTADDLAHRFLIADANILTSYRLTLDAADVLIRSDIGEFDVPRARDGGLDLVFAGLLIPARHQEAGDAKEVADRRVDEMLAIIERSDVLTLVTSPEQVLRAFEDGRIAIALAIENGAPIGSDLANLHHFYERGVRMVTLVHSRPNQIGDSSYSQHRPWKGLSPFGQGVVARDEPPGDAHRRLPHFRRRVLPGARAVQSARHRLSFVVPRFHAWLGEKYGRCDDPYAR